MGCDVEDLLVDFDRWTRHAGSPILIACVASVAVGIDSARAAGVRNPVVRGLRRLVGIVDVTRDNPGILPDQPSTAANGRQMIPIVGMVDLPDGRMGSRFDGGIPPKTVQHVVETRTNQRTVVTMLRDDHYRRGHLNDPLAFRLAMGAEQLLQSFPCSFLLAGCSLLSMMPAAGGHAWQRQ
jgi:hypothetical protein